MEPVSWSRKEGCMLHIPLPWYVGGRLWWEYACVCVCIEHNSRFHSDSFATWRFILDERAIQHTRSPAGGILLFDPIANVNICVPNIQKVYYTVQYKALSTSNCISQTMTVMSMFQTSALCFALFLLKLSRCVCVCLEGSCTRPPFTRM